MSYSEFIQFFSIIVFLILSIHLFLSDYGNKLLNILLGLLLLEDLAKLLFLNFLKQRPNYHLDILVFPSTVLFLLIPAIFYIYIRSFVNDQTRFRRFDWLHLLPVILTLIFVLFQGIDFFGNNKVSVFPNQTNNVSSSLASILITSRISLELIYLILAIKILVKLNVKGSSKDYKVGYFWILFLVTLRIVKNLVVIPIFIFQYKYSIKSIKTPHIDLDLIDSLFAFTMVLYLLNRPIIKFGIPRIFSDQILLDPSSKTLITEDNVTKKSSLPMLTPDLSISVDAFSKEISNYMATEKPWLNINFDISKMAADLKRPIHHCSFTIKMGLNNSFRNYINHFRVDNFISDHKTNPKNLTFEALSFESGFRNQSTFYSAFKKEKGMSPKVFFDDAANL
jgi:AraC-like DNA-binding protein